MLGIAMKRRRSAGTGDRLILGALLLSAFLLVLGGLPLLVG